MWAVVAGRGYNAPDMCGSYSLILTIGELQNRFDFDGDRLGYAPAYNIAPMQNVLTVVGGESRRGRYMRWGLIASWAKDKPTGNRMISARAETVAEKASFGNALLRRHASSSRTASTSSKGSERTRGP